ncbi:MAG: aminotransferase class III-fold pyridoxal phosphate-dependent enzyme, partial [Spirochaetota bacterium]
MEKDAASVKKAALADFARHISPMKVRTLKSAGIDIIEERRDGASTWDITGTKYIDCQTGSGIMNLGRHNAEMVRVLKEALDTYDIGVFLLASRQKAELAKKLASIAPEGLSGCVFGVGGGEAVDAAIKIARGSSGRPGIVYADKSYHGHTGFALSAIGREAYRESFGPLMPGFSKVPFGDIAAMEGAIGPDTAAVILEAIQGEGGINIPPDDYLPALRELCTQRGALLIIDEIQTGLGRTGAMFACEHWGLKPDIMTVAKS